MLFAWSASAVHSPSAGGAAGPHLAGAGSPHAGHGPGVSLAPLVPGLGMWLAMVLAMSPPLLIREIGTLWRTSLRRNRVLKSVLFLYGYLLNWALAGLAAVPLAAAITGSPALVWIAVLAVIGWQLCPPRRRLLNRCHRVPVTAAFGAEAYRHALRSGLGSGVLCVAICGPAMVLVLLAEQFHLVAMVVAALLLTGERLVPAKRRAAPGFDVEANPVPLLRGRSPSWRPAQDLAREPGPRT